MCSLIKPCTCGMYLAKLLKTAEQDEKSILFPREQKRECALREKVSHEIMYTSKGKCDASLTVLVAGFFIGASPAVGFHGEDMIGTFASLNQVGRRYESSHADDDNLGHEHSYYG